MFLPVSKDSFNVRFDFPAQRGYKQSDMCTSATFSDHKANLLPGDVLTVTRPDHADATGVTHSAVLIKGGADPIIRQKFDPNYPVVDLNVKQFSKAYLKESEMEIYVWRK